MNQGLAPGLMSFNKSSLLSDNLEKGTTRAESTERYVIRGEVEVESNVAGEANTNFLPERARCETAQVESGQSLGA
jgi:hypothetical protein